MDFRDMKSDPEQLRRDMPHAYAALTEEKERPPEPEPSWPERLDRRMMNASEPWRTLYCIVWLAGAALFGVIVFLGFLFLLGLMSPI